MTRVLLAPDKFKGSLTAADVAQHISAGLRRAVPGIVVDELPVADGGEGTVAAALAAGFAEIDVTATGPVGDPVRTRYAVSGETAVIEMASVSGLEMVDPTRETARHATSRGVGELVAHALERGARTVVIGVGGSASVDGGAGLLAALGARLLREDGTAVTDGGGGLQQIAAVCLDQLHPGLSAARLILASDVDNPLLGAHGAVAVYGPQKGLTAADIPKFEQGLARWRTALQDAGIEPAEHLAEMPGAGAAGGVGFALLCLGGARRPGVEVVLDLADFDSRVAGADLVITGEGSLDAQSLHGKTPIGVAAAAAELGVPTVAVCGRSLISSDQAAGANLAGVYALSDIEPNLSRCLTEPGPLLEFLAARVAKQHL